MVCPKCASPIEADALFCINCGEKVVREAAEQPVKENKLTAVLSALRAKLPSSECVISVLKKIAAFFRKLLRLRNIPALLGIVAGLIFLRAGLLIAMTADTTLSTASFGADFYTYAYRGLRAAEDALIGIQKACGGVMAAIGAFTGCFFLCKLCDGKDA